MTYSVGDHQPDATDVRVRPAMQMALDLGTMHEPYVRCAGPLGSRSRVLSDATPSLSIAESSHPVQDRTPARRAMARSGYGSVPASSPGRTSHRPRAHPHGAGLPPALPSHPPYSAGALPMPVLVLLLAPPLQNLDLALQGLDTWHSFHHLAVAPVPAALRVAPWRR